MVDEIVSDSPMVQMWDGMTENTMESWREMSSERSLATALVHRKAWESDIASVTKLVSSWVHR